MWLLLKLFLLLLLLFILLLRYNRLFLILHWSGVGDSRLGIIPRIDWNRGIGHHIGNGLLDLAGTKAKPWFVRGLPLLFYRLLLLHLHFSLLLHIVIGDNLVILGHNLGLGDHWSRSQDGIEIRQANAARGCADFSRYPSAIALVDIARMIRNLDGGG